MGLLIDTSILIGVERGTIDVDQLVRARADEEFYISVITASELLHGVHRAADAGLRRKRTAFVEFVIGSFGAIPIEMDVARIHAELWAEQAKHGAVIGQHDLWIAATCIARGLSLATHNEREFKRVKGLLVETWR